MSDPIGDMIIRIKNAALSGKKIVVLPHSRLKLVIARTLQKEGYLEKVEETGTAPKLTLTLALAYRGGMPVVTDVRRRSKPGMRVYIGRSQVPSVFGNMGIAILSTSRGIMTGKEAKKAGVGGELVCEVW